MDIREDLIDQNGNQSRWEVQKLDNYDGIFTAKTVIKAK
jgi:hypothetical protein